MGTTAAATIVCIFPPFLLGAMAVQVRADLGFSETGIGLGVGAFFLTASLLSAPMGRWAERVGGTRALRVAALWAGAGQLVIAAGARSFGLLLALMAFAGCANALGQPSANLVIARAVPVNRQGLGFAVKQSAIPFSTFLGGLAVPLVALTVGWRWAFVAAAGVAGLSALALDVPAGADDSAGAGPPRSGAADLLARTKGRRRKRPLRGRSYGAPQSPDQPSRPDLIAGDPAVAFPIEGEVASGTTGRLPLRIMAVLALGAAMGAGAAGSLGAFLVSSGVEAGLSEGSAGLALTAGSGLGIACRLAVGVLADRRSGGHLRWVAWMLGVGAFGYLFFATGRPALFLAGLPLAFGAGWAWPGLFNLAVVLANPASPAAATGVTQTGTYLGVVFGPLLFGAAAEHLSFAWGWWLVAAISWLGAAAIWTGRRMLQRDRDTLPA